MSAVENGVASPGEIRRTPGPPAVHRISASSVDPAMAVSPTKSCLRQSSTIKSNPALVRHGILPRVKVRKKGSGTDSPCKKTSSPVRRISESGTLSPSAATQSQKAAVLIPESRAGQPATSQPHSDSSARLGAKHVSGGRESTVDQARSHEPRRREGDLRQFDDASDVHQPHPSHANHPSEQRGRYLQRCVRDYQYERPREGWERHSLREGAPGHGDRYSRHLSQPKADMRSRGLTHQWHTSDDRHQQEQHGDVRREQHRRTQDRGQGQHYHTANPELPGGRYDHLGDRRDKGHHGRCSSPCDVSRGPSAEQWPGDERREPGRETSPGYGRFSAHSHEDLQPSRDRAVAQEYNGGEQRHRDRSGGRDNYASRSSRGRAHSSERGYSGRSDDHRNGLGGRSGAHVSLPARRGQGCGRSNSTGRIPCKELDSGAFGQIRSAEADCGQTELQCPSVGASYEAKPTPLLPSIFPSSSSCGEVKSLLETVGVHVLVPFSAPQIPGPPPLPPIGPTPGAPPLPPEEPDAAARVPTPAPPKPPGAVRTATASAQQPASTHSASKAYMHLPTGPAFPPAPPGSIRSDPTDAQPPPLPPDGAVQPHATCSGPKTQHQKQSQQRQPDTDCAAQGEVKEDGEVAEALQPDLPGHGAVQGRNASNHAALLNLCAGNAQGSSSRAVENTGSSGGVSGQKESSHGGEQRLEALVASTSITQSAAPLHGFANAPACKLTCAFVMKNMFDEPMANIQEGSKSAIPPQTETSSSIRRAGADKYPSGNISNCAGVRASVEPKASRASPHQSTLSHSCHAAVRDRNGNSKGDATVPAALPASKQDSFRQPERSKLQSVESGVAKEGGAGMLPHVHAHPSTHVLAPPNKNSVHSTKSRPARWDLGPSGSPAVHAEHDGHAGAGMSAPPHHTERGITHDRHIDAYREASHRELSVGVRHDGMCAELDNLSHALHQDNRTDRGREQAPARHVTYCAGETSGEPGNSRIAEDRSLECRRESSSEARALSGAVSGTSGRFQGASADCLAAAGNHAAAPDSRHDAFSPGMASAPPGMCVLCSALLLCG